MNPHVYKLTLTPHLNCLMRVYGMCSVIWHLVGNGPIPNTLPTTMHIHRICIHMLTTPHPHHHPMCHLPQQRMPHPLTWCLGIRMLDSDMHTAHHPTTHHPATHMHHPATHHPTRTHHQATRGIHDHTPLQMENIPQKALARPIVQPLWRPHLRLQ